MSLKSSSDARFDEIIATYLQAVEAGKPRIVNGCSMKP